VLSRETRRFARLVQVFSAACLVVLALVLSGCGGSSGSSANDWTVVTTSHSGRADYGLVNGFVGQPSQVEVTIATTPSVKASTHFTVACGPANYDKDLSRAGPTAKTPLTFRVPIPRPLNGPASCRVVGGADYPSNVETTMTLLQRSAPTTSP
jgi:hypothetical protein